MVFFMENALYFALGSLCGYVLAYLVRQLRLSRDRNKRRPPYAVRREPIMDRTEIFKG